MTPVKTYNFALSHSSLKTKASCARKYELYKVLNHPALIARQDTIHTIFGKAVGEGVAHLLAYPDDLDGAFHIAFCAWKFPLYERLHGKFFSSALSALEDFQTKARHMRDMGYTLAEINGRPASELSFKINVTGYGYYVGFIDAVLYNAHSGKFITVECKTMNRDFHPSIFMNSKQDTGYLAVARVLEAFDSEVLYPILTAKTGGNHWTYASYDRSEKDFDEFFKTLLLEFQHLALMADHGTFPRNGDSCFAYSRLCPLYGECDKEQRAHPPKDNPMEYDLEITL